MDGRVAEWLMAADCKSARVSVRWFESSPFHQLNKGFQPGAFFVGLMSERIILNLHPARYWVRGVVVRQAERVPPQAAGRG